MAHLRSSLVIAQSAGKHQWQGDEWGLVDPLFDDLSIEVTLVKVGQDAAEGFSDASALFLVVSPLIELHTTGDESGSIGRALEVNDDASRKERGLWSLAGDLLHHRHPRGERRRALGLSGDRLSKRSIGFSERDGQGRRLREPFHDCVRFAVARQLAIAQKLLGDAGHEELFGLCEGSPATLLDGKAYAAELQSLILLGRRRAPLLCDGGRAEQSGRAEDRQTDAVRNLHCCSCCRVKELRMMTSSTCLTALSRSQKHRSARGFSRNSAQFPVDNVSGHFAAHQWLATDTKRTVSDSLDLRRGNRASRSRSAATQPSRHPTYAVTNRSGSWESYSDISDLPSAWQYSRRCRTGVRRSGREARASSDTAGGSGGAGREQTASGITRAAPSKFA